MPNLNFFKNHEKVKFIFKISHRIVFSTYIEDGDVMKANEMKKKQKAKICEIHLPEKEKQRLLSLGIGKGVSIQFLMRDPCQTVMIFLIQDVWIAIEEKLAKHMEVCDE